MTEFNADIRPKSKGSELTSKDWNNLVARVRALENITAVQGSGITIARSPSGVKVGHYKQYLLTVVPVICTAVDTPSDGLHTFAECDLTGTAISDGVSFASCKLLGDWTAGTWLPSATAGSQTRGLLFNFQNTNIVMVLGGYYMS